MKSKVKISDNSKLECFIAQFTNIDFKLDSGALLENLTIAYKTFGKLNEEKSNASKATKDFIDFIINSYLF
jgi:homoserine acetyltransferase